MGLGAAILIVTLFGCLVAGFVPGKGVIGVVGAVAGGLLASLLIGCIWIPLASISDPQFIETELRLAAIAILPICLSAFIGLWVRKNRSSKGKK